MGEEKLKHHQRIKNKKSQANVYLGITRTRRAKKVNAAINPSYWPRTRGSDPNCSKGRMMDLVEEVSCGGSWSVIGL